MAASSQNFGSSSLHRTAAAEEATTQGQEAPQTPAASLSGFVLVDDYLDPRKLFGAASKARKAAGSRLRLIATSIGESVTRAVTSSLITGQLLALPAVARSSIGAASTKMAAAQMSGTVRSALAVIRVPLSSAAGGGAQGVSRMAAFTDAIKTYAAGHVTQVNDVAKLSAGTAAVFSLEASIVGALVCGAVQETMELGRYVAGSTNPEEFRNQTAQIVISLGGSLLGGAGGAAVGTILFPGAGTALGSMLGSYLGCFLAIRGWGTAKPKEEYEAIEDDPDAARTASRLRLTDDTNAQRTPATAAAPRGDDWLVISDTSALAESASASAFCLRDHDANAPMVPPSQQVSVASLAAPPSNQKPGEGASSAQQHMVTVRTQEELNDLLDTCGPEELLLVYECTPEGEDEETDEGGVQPAPTNDASSAETGPGALGRGEDNNDDDNNDDIAAVERRRQRNVGVEASEFAATDRPDEFVLHSRRWRCVPQPPPPPPPHGMRSEGEE